MACFVHSVLLATGVVVQTVMTATTAAQAFSSSFDPWIVFLSCRTARVLVAIVFSCPMYYLCFITTWNSLRFAGL